MKKEIEKLEIQRELTADSDSKDVFYKTIEEFQTKLKMMEEQKEKDEDEIEDETKIAQMRTGDTESLAVMIRLL